MYKNINNKENNLCVAMEQKRNNVRIFSIKSDLPQQELNSSQSLTMPTSEPDLVS